MNDEQPTVLVVDDEPDLADLYAAWLGDDYETLTVYGGRPRSRRSTSAWTSR